MAVNLFGITSSHSYVVSEILALSRGQKKLLIILNDMYPCF
uniref:Uncharacterized protein n=1 Tax=Rhizophora mucronata TaxID=61149 RepID=A0A2P2PT70_RHIMU